MKKDRERSKPGKKLPIVNRTYILKYDIGGLSVKKYRGVDKKITMYNDAAIQVKYLMLD